MGREIFKIENAKCLKHARKDESISVLLVLVPMAPRPEWIPWDHVDDDSDVWKAGDEGTLIVSAWLAERKGWL